MINLRTQFEIRYSTLLNFKSEYKAIFSPYLKFCEFNINNADTIEEYIVLTFREEKFSIDCRWDRIVFVSEGPREDLKKSQGPLFYFFEIFDKLRKLTTFGKIKNIVLAEWNLVEYQLEIDEVKSKFKSTFLSNKSIKPPSDLQNEDLSITFIYGNKNEKYQRITFGPFVPSEDILTYNLVPISRKISKDLENKKGIFSESFFTEKTHEADLDSYKKANRAIEGLLKELKFDE